MVALLTGFLENFFSTLRVIEACYVRDQVFFPITRCRIMKCLLFSKTGFLQEYFLLTKGDLPSRSDLLQVSTSSTIQFWLLQRRFL